MATTELRDADPYTAVESWRATREEDGPLVIDMKTDTEVLRARVTEMNRAERRPG